MKKPWLAGLLSFIFPGIGQFYNAKVLAGILFLGIYIFTIVLSGGILGEAFVLVGIISFPLVWLISIIHAVISARNINDQTNIAPDAQ